MQKEEWKREWNKYVCGSLVGVPSSLTVAAQFMGQPSRPIQWHLLCPGSSWHNSRAQIRHCLAAGAWIGSFQLALGQVQASDSELMAGTKFCPSASGRDWWTENERMGSGWVGGAGWAQHGVSSVSCVVWFRCYKQRFSKLWRLKSGEMSEWIPKENIKKQCLVPVDGRKRKCWRQVLFC